MQSWIEERYGEQNLFDFYAGNVAENEGLVADYVEEIGLRMPVLLVSSQIAQQYAIRGNASPYPRDYIIDGDGIVQYAQHEYEPELMLMTLDRLLEIADQPTITIRPDTLRFGDVNIGESLELPVRLRNEGNANLLVRDCVIDNEYYSADFEEEFIIEPGDSSSILIAFYPCDAYAVGELSGTAIISSNDPQLNEATVYLSGTGVDIENVEQNRRGNSPISYYLAEPFPNPFNSCVAICFGLPEEVYVTLGFYDISGKTIIPIFAGQCPAGDHQLNWQTSDIPTGVYFLCMRAGDYKYSRKIALIR